jgi:hypothetical protein
LRTNVDAKITNVIITVKKEMITDKPKLEPNKITRSNTVSTGDEIYQKGIMEIRIVQANRSNIERLNQNFFQNIINNVGRTRRKRKKKYSFKITQNEAELTNDSNLFNEGEYSLGYTWNKRRKKKKKFWKGYWKKMINNFEGDVKIKYVFRKTKKE